MKHLHLATLATLALSGSAITQNVVFHIALHGGQEVPANNSAGIGFATVVLNQTTGTVSILGSYSGLGTSRVAQHIHGAAAGSNGGVLIPLSGTGGTSGTNMMEDMPAPMRVLFKTIGVPIFGMMGLMHDLETGAKRYVDGLNDTAYKTGVFYASPFPITTGKLVDQGTIFADLNNETYQDNANEAIHRFVQ